MLENTKVIKASPEIRTRSTPIRVHTRLSVWPSILNFVPIVPRGLEEIIFFDKESKSFIFWVGVGGEREGKGKWELE